MLLLETLEVQLGCFSFSQYLTFFPLVNFFTFGFQWSFEGVKSRVFLDFICNRLVLCTLASLLVILSCTFLHAGFRYRQAVPLRSCLGSQPSGAQFVLPLSICSSSLERCICCPTPTPPRACKDCCSVLGVEEIEFMQLMFREDPLSSSYFGGTLHGAIMTEGLHFGEGMHRRAFRSRVLQGLAPAFAPGHPCVLKVHSALTHGAKSRDELLQRNYSLALQVSALAPVTHSCAPEPPPGPNRWSVGCFEQYSHRRVCCNTGVLCPKYCERVCKVICSWSWTLGRLWRSTRVSINIYFISIYAYVYHPVPWQPTDCQD